MSRNMILVDCESTGPTPYRSVLTEFGAVNFETSETFYARLWPFTPHPDNPALPVVADGAAPSIRVEIDGAEVAAGTSDDVYALFAGWLHRVCGGLHPSFISDNPAFDFMWIADGFDRAALDNPFGFSARRIGDFAAGLSGNWKKHTGWKKYRKTPHDHNPVNDAMGNAQALRALLALATE